MTRKLPANGKQTVGEAGYDQQALPDRRPTIEDWQKTAPAPV
jgi:hypothetical protein